MAALSKQFPLRDMPWAMLRLSSIRLQAEHLIPLSLIGMQDRPVFIIPLFQSLPLTSLKTGRRDDFLIECAAVLDM
jgi:hypothetical protein